MKVGTLIRALSLLLVLPSATVLSLTGGIDRTMKVGLALFLLGSMKTVMAADKTIVDGCGPMFCYAPKSCKLGGSDHKLAEVDPTDALASNCPALLKTRPYSDKMYRVVLESRDPKVTEITLTRDGDGTPLFSCKVGLSQYKGKPAEPIGSSTGALKCEFIAEDETDSIFTYSSKEVKLVADGDNSISSEGEEGLLFTNAKKLYCDPKSATYDKTNPGDNSITEAIVGVTDLSCPKPYQMETQLTSGPTDEVFHKTTSVVCEEDLNDTNPNKNKFKLEREGGPQWIPRDETFAYRCATKTCTLCDFPPQANATTLDITDGTDGCKELKCKQNRLKVGDTLGDKAICKKNNDDKPVWSLEGTLIEASTSVVCFEKMKCDASICNNTTIDHCVISLYEGVRRPMCTGSYLTYQSERVTVDCDGNTGKWMYNDGSRPPAELPAGEVLSCLSDSGASGKADPAGANVSLYAGIGALAAIFFIAGIVAAIFLVMKKKRAAKNGKTGKSVETANAKSQSKSVNSKESKKEELDVLPPEYTCPESPPPETAKLRTLRFIRPDCSEAKRREKEAKKIQDDAVEAAFRRNMKGLGEERNDQDQVTKKAREDDETLAFVPEAMQGTDVFKEKGKEEAADKAPAAAPTAAAPAAKEKEKK